MLLWPFNKYPGTDYETFNWEWILKTVKETVSTVKTFMDELRGEWAAWLDGIQDTLTNLILEHPEWVTTVMPNSITSDKIQASFLQAITNAYVTPEQFGAIGDGVTDDTAAFTQAIATKLPIIGDPNKLYYIDGLTVRDNSLYFCYFTGRQLANTGMYINSYTHLVNCRFTQFYKCVSHTTTVVHASIENCRFTYSTFGVYFDVTSGGESINNIIIRGCYFSKCGPANVVDDYTAQYTEGLGHGLHLAGNWDGVQITDNVFEYCSYTGIYLYNDNSNFRTGASIRNNYFEGNKYCAIYVYITRTGNMVAINDNYFSYVSTNVFNTKYMEWVRGTSEYIPEDVDKRTIESASTGATLNQWHQAVITGSNNYLGIVPVKYYGTDPNRVCVLRYKANITADTQLRAGDASTVLGTFKNGIGEIVIPYTTSFYVNRLLPSNESIIITKYDVA